MDINETDDILRSDHRLSMYRVTVKFTKMGNCTVIVLEHMPIIRKHTLNFLGEKV